MTPKTADNKPIRVRMAPSPTGPLHIGTARTTLTNLLYARHTGGTFVLRIENTDKERSKKEHEIGLIEGLHWLGIDWDEGPLLDGGEKGEYGPYRQSERTEIYRKYLEQLMASGHAYYCYCTKEDLEAEKQEMAAAGLQPKYRGRCRNLSAPPEGKSPETIRFVIPEVEVEFKDMVRGTVKFDAGLFGDVVIAKNLDSPLYNFAVVVDDELMKISHVIRGEEHIGNTPKQILIARALGFEPPIFAHLPLILNADKSKMSKRFGDTALSQYKDKGYLPQVIVNFIALLGWHPKDDREILTMDDLAAEFDIERVQKGGAVFDQNKLDWMNKEYLKKMSDEEIATELVNGKWVMGRDADLIKKIVAVERSRAATLSDFVENGKLFFALPDYDAALLVWKETPRENVTPVLKDAYDLFSAMPENDFTMETIKARLDELAEGKSKGEIYWPVRVALSGSAASPDPASIMTVLGKAESLRRIEIALEKSAAGY